MFAFLHPVETKGCGPIVEAVQGVHPGNLVWKWNLAQTDQGDADAAAGESSDQLAGIGPHAAYGVGSDENVHRQSERKNPRHAHYAGAYAGPYSNGEVLHWGGTFLPAMPLARYCTSWVNPL